MKIFYTKDIDNRVFPVCDWREDMEAEEGWLVGEMPGNAYESHGVPRYKDVNGVITEREPIEIQSDVDALPIPEPTESEQLRADVDFLTMENEALEEQVEQDRADIDYLLMISEE